MDSESTRKLEEEVNLERYKNSLSFVLLPLFLRHVGGGIPEWATQEGYDPNESEQMVIFGDEQILRSFIKFYNLESEKYPIHDAKMGVHIDIYSGELIDNFKKIYPLTSAKEYWEEKKQV